MRLPGFHIAYFPFYDEKLNFFLALLTPFALIYRL